MKNVLKISSFMVGLVAQIGLVDAAVGRAWSCTITYSPQTKVYMCIPGSGCTHCGIVDSNPGEGGIGGKTCQCDDGVRDDKTKAKLLNLSAE